MKTKNNKIYASKGKILYCEKLNKYATATTDLKNKWVEIPEEERSK